MFASAYTVAHKRLLQLLSIDCRCRCCASAMVESDAEAVSATSLGVQVQYCSECSMPFEYCEYGPLYEKKCKANLMRHAPHLLAGKLNAGSPPHTHTHAHTACSGATADESEMLERLQLDSNSNADASGSSAAAAAAATTSSLTAAAASAKKKGAKAAAAVCVLVSRMARKGKKCTYIQNLDAFGSAVPAPPLLLPLSVCVCVS